MGLYSGVCCGGECAEFLFCLFADVECFYELSYALLVNGGVGPGELFEGFVGVGVSFASEYGLYAFGHYAPHVVEVGFDGCLVEQEFVEPFEC